MSEVSTSFEGVGLIYGTGESDQVLITALNVDPRQAPGFAAPEGTVVITTAGAHQKIGPLDTDWTFGVPIGTLPVYGSQLQYVEDDIPQTTTTRPSSPNNILTGSFPAQYMTISTPVLPLGTYELNWNYGYNSDTTTGDFIARMRHVGATPEFFGLHRQESKDSASGNNSDAPAGSGSNQRFGAGFFKQFSNLSGQHTFTLEFASSQDGSEATIIDGAMRFKRVA